MTLECIYTFYEDKEQEVRQYDVTKHDFKRKKDLVKFVTDPLSKHDVANLLKVSCCIITRGEKLVEPKWYDNCNGKLWFDKGKNVPRSPFQ